MLRRFGKRPLSSSQDSEDSSDLWQIRLDKEEDDSSWPPDRRSSDPALSTSPSLRIPTTRHASAPGNEIYASQPRSNSRSPSRLFQKREIVDKLGLSLVHSDPEPQADLIFVHGLGGASRRTWSWQRDPQNFWPSWLGEEAELFKTRIFTFGYNADFSGQDRSSNILDFARELLFQMKTYADTESPNSEPIGQYPIIFVMHSLGGLVVKKAYIVGRSDKQYEDIISQTHAMLFLATPHRGSAYADILNNVLRSAPGLSSKVYVSELEKTSTSLQDINEQFRHICGNMDMVSFYETQKTPLALGLKKLIVGRDSAVLGYQTEISSSLNADHHGVCKFSGIDDPNYEQVRNVLRMFIRKLKTSVPSDTLGDTNTATTPDTKRLQELFGIHDDPKDDFESSRDRIMEGTCKWILQRQSYREWKDISQPGSKLLWLTGSPGAGKSVLSAFILNDCESDPDVRHYCYYFFKSEHQTKRSISQMLSSIALQTALASRSFRERLLERCDAGSLFPGRQKANNIWEFVFEGILFRQRFEQPIFWVIDGLDEADHPELLIKLLGRLQSNTEFRILIASRLMKEIALQSFSNLQVTYDSITISDTEEDIRSYVLSEISNTLNAERLRGDVCDKVLEKSQGSFLWVTLAMEQLRQNWHTQDDIHQVLNDLPAGMEPLYARMIDSIVEQPTRPREIASRMLSWVVCSFRPLELQELAVALSLEFGEFLSLDTTLTQICGNFVRVDKSRVTLIHDTARHFLLYRTVGLPLSIDYRLSHEHIAKTCLSFLIDPKRNWKRKLAQAQPGRPTTTQSRQQGAHPAWFDSNPFFSYAAMWWSYHVSLGPSQSGVASLVHDFLGQSCLVWINGIALLGDMRVLARAAQYIKLFYKKRNRKLSHESLQSLIGSRDDELKQWSKDLIRVVGRFGNILAENPLSIYKYIVPFCPSGSIINETFKSTSIISVVGISSETWDDCLARLTMGGDEMAVKVICRGAYFATLIGNGVVIVWYAESCGEARRLDHGEWVSVMECSKVSPLIVTAGSTTIKVWDISTGEELYCLPKCTDRRILAVSFSARDEELLIGYDDSSVQCVTLATAQEQWKHLLEVPGDLEHPCPHLVSISPDQYQAIIGYRGRPLYAWSLDSQDQEPQVCIRPEDRFGSDHDASARRAGTPERVVWRPGLAAVLILYNDATLFEWDLELDIQKLIPSVEGIELAISSDGNMLLVSDYNGTLSIWTVPEFRLTYRLEESDMVRSLAFSPDGQRFYDIRGPLCNVWEPDTLIRSDDLDRDELSSSHDTASSEPVSGTSGSLGAQITALVHDTEDKFYCCGKDSGVVVLYEMATGQKIRKVYGHATIASVVEIAWSRTCRFIASADDCGRIIAKRLRKPSPENNSWGVFPLLDFRLGDAITQVLFSPSEEYLLVSSSTLDSIWNLKTRKEMIRSERWAKPGHKWLNHPTKPDVLLSIDYGGTHFFRWGSFVEIGMASLRPIKESEPQEDLMQHLSITGSAVDPAQSREDVMLIERPMPVNADQVVFDAYPDIGRNWSYISQRQVMLASITSDLSHSPLKLVLELSDHVHRLVGCFMGLVVFLDHHYCFCTWNLHGGQSLPKRHFHLPKDWLSPEMLKLCMVTSHGTVLCPKNGEVAVIRHGIKV